MSSAARPLPLHALTDINERAARERARRPAAVHPDRDWRAVPPAPVMPVIGRRLVSALGSSRIALRDAARAYAADDSLENSRALDAAALRYALESALAGAL